MDMIRHYDEGSERIPGLVRAAKGSLHQERTRGVAEGGAAKTRVKMPVEPGERFSGMDLTSFTKAGPSMKGEGVGEAEGNEINHPGGRPVR